MEGDLPFGIGELSWKRRRSPRLAKKSAALVVNSTNGVIARNVAVTSCMNLGLKPALQNLLRS